MPEPIDWNRQLRQHLDALREAGVEFVSSHSVEPAASPESPPTDTSSLFAEVVPEVAPLTPEQRRQELTLLAEEVRKCKKCDELVACRTQTVFGVGNWDEPDLCFIGEAPGADEDRLGEPFVGAAGQLLNKIIAAMGMRREEVYICNVLRCRPPGNRKPELAEAKNCRPFLDRTLELVRPKFLCALGVTAANTLLGNSLSMARLRGKFHSYNGIPLLCTYHPASLLPSRSPENKRLVWEDMKLLLTQMGRPIPKSGG